MSKNIYVTTYSEESWDCVGSVYEAESEETVYKYLAEERDSTVDEIKAYMIVHKQDSIIKL